MYNKINTLKSKILPKNLYSRLTLITLVTVMTGYAIIYAYTTINSTEYAPSAPLTSTLMGKIVGNLDELNTKISNFGFNGGNIGIGIATPLRQFSLKSSVPVMRFEDTDAGGAVGEINVNNNFGSIIIDSDASNAIAGSYTSFQVDGTEKMRIDTNGNLNVGKGIYDTTTTGLAFSPLGGMTIANPSTALGAEFIILNNNTTGTHTNTALSFRRNNASVGSITFTNASTQYNTTSDYRLKENVVELTGALNRLSNLPVHRFNYISNPKLTMDGFLAHEVQKVIPESVTGKKDAVDDKGKPIYQQVDYSKVVPLLTAGIKELNSQIQKQQKQIEELKSKIKILENK
ncbi:tail fiber domain-containing protein [Candidatus Gracilibacteria bacterium]|nr:tail fiber domain-containing protein [Candidatus Gracilibacteria bacterium]